MYQLGDTSPFFPLLRQVFIQESAIQEQLINGTVTTTAPAPAPALAPAPAPTPAPTAPILVPTTAPAPTAPIVATAPVVTTPLDVYEYRYQPTAATMPFVETYPTRSGEVVPEPRPAPAAPDGTLLWILAVGFGLFIILGRRERR